ncbi:MAG TPA: 50S ribosomal protein L29 [Candidatus Nanoarchaeia archaeon]|nr:50S ribosomal protein L29 [Candidatus Nanoarchaeia archaeon]
MAVLKKSELKKMSTEEMNKRMLEIKKELMKLRAQASRGTQPENPGKIRALRRAIARILTVQNQKKVGGA